MESSWHHPEKKDCWKLKSDRNDGTDSSFLVHSDVDHKNVSTIAWTPDYPGDVLSLTFQHQYSKLEHTKQRYFFNFVLNESSLKNLIVLWIFIRILSCHIDSLYRNSIYLVTFPSSIPGNIILIMWQATAPTIKFHVPFSTRRSFFNLVEIEV